MHSVAVDSGGSPKKRTLSRGLSEDESLRSIIKEVETPSRRLTRSDSRPGTLKKRSDSQLELQASYDEVVQELRGLEVEREALLFQVDILQDTLEGVEELLAEAQREAGQSSSELEREREAKRKLESMVSSLMQEVERLKEERNNEPSAPANTHGSAAEEARQGHKDSSLCEGRASEKLGQSGEAEEEEGVLTKLKKMVSKPLSHLPSLALDNPISEDGVLRRPYENGVEDGRDPSPDRNDSDSISAYEDASAETPEQDRMFPGEEEMPHDSEKSSTNNCQVNESNVPNPDGCVVS
ncbi:hypothetical protein D9C73_005047 [Collichthys lucidus]|uniref:Leucine-rich repeat flightless-interacting protein 1 n=1 Tax=Collichthys lucidus TaxID=240159 RepID=A0A4U5UC13_COLLU|nr:hypothetical protein D9C73_005047 [Collichthys lucidus]